MVFFLLFFWSLISATIGLLNVNYFTIPLKTQKIILFLTQILGNLLWVSLIFLMDAKRTFYFLIVWMAIYGLGTNLLPIVIKKIKLYTNQKLGLFLVVVGVILIWSK